MLLGGSVLVAQTSLEGKLTDAETGEPLLFANVILFKDGVQIAGTETDFDGIYSITNVDPGTYSLEASYTGYATQLISGVNLGADKLNKVDIKLSAGEVLQAVEVVYTKPLIEQDNTSQGGIVTSEEIQNLPVKSINAIAASTAGVAVSDAGDTPTIRGSRSESTDYYIDGIRVSGTLIPQSEIEQLQVITGGIEARYGDVTGGIISITTKGPSSRFRGGVEVETSELFNDYGYNLLSANLSGPILKKGDRTVLGYRVSGQYLLRDEDDPAALPIIVARDDVLAELEQNPIRVVNGAPVNAAEFLTNDDVVRSSIRPNSGSEQLDLTLKLDARLTNDIDVTLTGSFRDRENLFIPFQNGGVSSRQLLNTRFNPTSFTDQYRGNFRFRHRVGNQGQAVDTSQVRGLRVDNAVYTLQFGYENEDFEVFDPRHGDNFFDYGFIGNWDYVWEPTFAFTGDPSMPLRHSDYLRTFQGYTPGDANPILARYNAPFADDGNDNSLIARNGFISAIFDQTFNNFFDNPGRVYNNYQRTNEEVTTFLANASFQLVPKNSINRHTVQFGLQYEQVVERQFRVIPENLWTIARQQANRHILGVDTTNVIGSQMLPNPFNPNEMLEVPIYGNLIEEQGDLLFYQRVREVTGDALNEFTNIDGLTPDQLSLDMFSARELNDARLLSYYGYNYTGTQESDVTFDEFFTSTDQNGIRDFPIAPFRPVYAAGFIQDKFKFKDVIFRLGLRVDYFDANTKVLKDPYALYEIRGASDFHSQFGGERPGNIGDDFAVYTTTDNGETVRAYRDGDQWYFANGQPANDGADIFNGEIAFPSYTNPDANIQGRDFDPNISFDDYEPQVNWMPRLAFSFPISDEANFFAHYDVLVERPQSNNLVTPRTYFYFEETSSNTIRNNANLRPQTTVDYEVGFQQLLSENSALKVSAYYKELRDLIQARFFLSVPAQINQYQTYDNIDFGTVKGFQFQYDLRRTGNVQLNANYTLQFADGTGSDANSTRGLATRGLQRTLFPLSFDERHRFNLVLDYRYGEKDFYNGPRVGGRDILSNFGINLQGAAVSGRPYTANSTPEIRGGSGTVGSINGARLPWNFFLNAQADKSFTLNLGEDKQNELAINVYVRVSNVLNRRNIVNVYTATGSPTDDGYLASPRGASQLIGFEGTGRSLDSFLASYQWRLLNPNFFTLPRQTFLGAIVNF